MFKKTTQTNRNKWEFCAEECKPNHYLPLSRVRQTLCASSGTNVSTNIVWGPSMLWVTMVVLLFPSLWLPWQTLDADWHTVEITPIDRRVMVPTPAVGWPYLDVANTRERKWFLPDCSVPTVKFGGGSVMVLGCFSWFGVGSLVLMTKTMNDVHCLDVLDNYCTTNIWQYFGGRPLLPTRQHTMLLRLLQSG